MKPRRRSLLFALGLAIFIGLALWQREVFIAYVITPVAGVIWLVYRLCLSIDQEIYWAMAIGAALVLAIVLWTGRRETSIPVAYQNSIQENDQLAYWETIIANAEVNEKDRQILQRELQALNRSVGALVDNKESAEIHLMTVPKGIRSKIDVRLSMLFHFLLPDMDPRTSEYEQQINGILSKMEDQMEIHHDR